MRVAIVIGTIVLLCMRMPIAIVLHYMRHPLPSKIREEGIVAFSKHTDVVPYGFRHPIRWTSAPPTCPMCKHDALPVHVIEMLTRHDWTGSRLGTSLFIDGSCRRAARKERYMEGLTESAIDEYKVHMREVFLARHVSMPVEGCMLLRRSQIPKL